MRAIQYRKYGDVSNLEEAQRPKPRPNHNQILVKVAYSSVNPIDWKLREGMMRFLLPLRVPVIPGFDVASEVVEIGSNVNDFKIAGWVYARIDSFLFL